MQDAQNPPLKGDQLFVALQQKSWDPSVKSLTPFPRILRMLDANIEWTEGLGEAYLADPAAVMDAVQRLRRRAQSAGRLVTTPQVRTEQEPTRIEEPITIEAPSPEIVYVPICDPAGLPRHGFELGHSVGDPSGRSSASARSRLAPGGPAPSALSRSTAGARRCPLEAWERVAAGAAAKRSLFGLSPRLGRSFSWNRNSAAGLDAPHDAGPEKSAEAKLWAKSAKGSHFPLGMD